MDASDGPGGGTLWTSGGPGIFAFDKVVQLRNGAPAPFASGELGAEVPSRNDEAALVVPG